MEAVSRGDGGEREVSEAVGADGGGWEARVWLGVGVLGSVGSVVVVVVVVGDDGVWFSQGEAESWSGG